MGKLGFSYNPESSWKHDSFRKKSVHVEMHKRLTDDSELVQIWERELWKRAELVCSQIYKMSHEDFYIFHFVHLYKDFLNGSLGLRRIVDTWLLQKLPMNTKKIKTTLQSFGIWKFHENMVKLCRVTMGDGPMDEDSEVLLIHAFMYGIYGTRKSYKTGRIVTMGRNLRIGKIKSALTAVFLPYKRMKAQFPVLVKWPILLPYCWLRRIIRFMKGDMKKNRRMLDYSEISELDYTEMRRFFKAGGII